MKVVNGWQHVGYKPQVDWDGKGKHPILDMTIEEIRAFNLGVIERHAGRQVDTKEKALLPTSEQTQTLALQEAQYKSERWIAGVAKSLEAAQNMPTEVRSESL